MSGGFNDPIVGGGGSLVYPSIHSPGFVQGTTGWSIDKNGNAYFRGITLTGGSLVISGTADGVFIYSDTPALGNLIGSWASTAGTDAYGNNYTAGLDASQGALSGVLLSSPTITGAIISGASVSAPSITNPAISGGTITQTTYSIGTSGGEIFVYTTTTTSTTFSTAGQTTWTSPSSNCPPSADVQVWGGSAGGGGGSSSYGGEAGGGGEYAEEAAWPITANTTYQIVVGGGGTGGTTGNPGTDGGQSSFGGVGGVVASGGSAGASYAGGAGGTGSTNRIHHDGGAGGSNPQGSGDTGGAGGGGSAGASGAGGAGGSVSSSSGAAGGAAGSGGGAGGGGGGSSGASGTAGTAPGGGGGGAGAATAPANQQIKYVPLATYAYYGTDASTNPAGLENTNGAVIQGQYSGGGGNGTQYSYIKFNTSQIQSDWSGWTIDSISFAILNQHSWYNSGMYTVIDTISNTSFGSTHSTSGDANVINWGSPFVAEGAVLVADLSGSASRWQNGQAATIRIGPGPGVGSGGNLSYYGYFEGGTTGSSPSITITGHKGTTEQAGGGAAGQVTVTYTSTNNLLGSISGVAGTDAFGNSYPAGFYHNAQSGTPVAPASLGAILFANVNGNPSAITKTEFTGQIPLAQSDTTAFTLTSGSGDITKSWSIPANDAQAGTLYRLTVLGYCTGGTQRPAISMNLSGSLINLITYGVNMDNATNTWRCVIELLVLTTGTSGAAYINGFISISDISAGSSQGTWDSGDGSITINTTVSNTLSMYWHWINNANVFTLGSLFERLGP